MTTSVQSQDDIKSLEDIEIETDKSCNSNLPQNSPINKSLYICRRLQVLKDTDKKPEKWKNYLKMRSLLLKQRYGSSVSNAVENRSLSKIFSKMNINNDTKFGDKTLAPSIVATKEAKASRAIVGGSSIIENYAFVGVHHVFDQHTKCVTMVKFANNDSSKLCCSSKDSTLSICDVLSQPPSVLATLEGHSAQVTAFDWSGNNDLIASTSYDSTVRIWSALKYKCLSVISDSREIQIMCCIFQPINNNLLVIGNCIGEIRIINISTGRYTKEMCRIGGCVLSLAFDNSGRILWAGNDKGEIFSIRCELNGKLFNKTKRLTSSTPSSITSLSFRVWTNREARDPMLLVNSSNNSVSLFSIVDSEGGLSLKKKFYNHHKSNPVKSTFCPMMSFRQGACVVTGSEDGNIYFLDIQKQSNKACFNALQGHSKPVVGVSFNYNESLLATSDLEGLVIIWKRADLPQIELEIVE